MGWDSLEVEHRQAPHRVDYEVCQGMPKVAYDQEALEEPVALGVCCEVTPRRSPHLLSIFFASLLSHLYTSLLSQLSISLDS